MKTIGKVEALLGLITLTVLLGIVIGISIQLKEPDNLDVEESLPSADIPDYSQRLETLEGHVDYLKEKMDELQARIQGIQDGINGLLETFDISAAETYTLTAYAPLDPKAVYGLDYIGNPSVTASGDKPVPGQTVAAAKDIPFGTRVWIEGVGIRTVNDRGGAIKRGRLDLCMETRDEALQFGRQRRKVIILKEGQK